MANLLCRVFKRVLLIFFLVCLLGVKVWPGNSRGTNIHLQLKSSDGAHQPRARVPVETSGSLLNEIAQEEKSCAKMMIILAIELHILIIVLFFMYTFRGNIANFFREKIPYLRNKRRNDREDTFLENFSFNSSRFLGEDLLNQAQCEEEQMKDLYEENEHGMRSPALAKEVVRKRDWPHYSGYHSDQNPISNSRPGALNTQSIRKKQQPMISESSFKNERYIHTRSTLFSPQKKLKDRKCFEGFKDSNTSRDMKDQLYLGKDNSFSLDKDTYPLMSQRDVSFPSPASASSSTRRKVLSNQIQSSQCGLPSNKHKYFDRAGIRRRSSRVYVLRRDPCSGLFKKTFLPTSQSRDRSRSYSFSACEELLSKTPKKIFKGTSKAPSLSPVAGSPTSISEIETLD